jgi:putative transposase
MPWPPRQIVKIRHELVLKALAREESMADVAREFGVSRKTAYKWLKRYKKVGLTGLVDESRRPASSPMATTAELAFEAVEVRKKHPSWGPKKIAVVLQRRHPGAETPSQSTVARILKHAGLMTRRTRRSSGGIPMRAPEFVAKAPNDLWTVDFKGWWRTQDGTKCEPLTVRDAHSRFMLALKLMERTRTEDVRPVFEELFKRYGLPIAIQSDNGPPFASVRAPRGLTELSAWWVSLGIQVVRSRPGCPQDNGGHERMHVDVRFDLEDNADVTREQQQRSCDDWLTVFNFERPHEALGMKVPGDVYRASERRMTRYVIGGYPEGCEMAKVSCSGKINYGDRKFFISNGVARHRVGLLPVGDLVQVWFYQLLLGSFSTEPDGHFEPYSPHEDDPPAAEEKRTTTRETERVLPDVTASTSPV